MSKKTEEPLEILPPYITVELSNKNHVVAHKIIGTKHRFAFVARCQNRATADKLTKQLNDTEKA